MKKKLILSVSVALLVVMTMLLFVACASTPDAKKLAKKVEAKGYSVEYYDADTSHNEETFIQVLHAWNETSDGNALIVYWYPSEKEAKKAYDEFSKQFDDEKDYGVKIKGKAVGLGIPSLLELL